MRNVGDDEVIMYLSVTPHILPTHTFWTEDGEKMPPRFARSASFDQESDTTVAVGDRADEHLQSVEGFPFCYSKAQLVALLLIFYFMK